jgi:hypothetical protein
MSRREPKSDGLSGDPADVAWDLWRGCADADSHDILFGTEITRRIRKEIAVNRSLELAAEMYRDAGDEPESEPCRPQGDE